MLEQQRAARLGDVAGKSGITALGHRRADGIEAQCQNPRPPSLKAFGETLADA